MDSHEEKIQVALRQAKEEAADAEMRRHAKSIQDRKMAQLRQNLVSGQGLGQGMGAPTGGMQGFGGGGPPQGGGLFDQFNENGGQQQYQQYQAPAPAKPEPPKVLAKGMKLGGGSAVKKDNLMAAMAAEDNLFPLASSTGFGAVAAKPAAAPSTPLTLALEEKITVVMNREGSIDSSDVKGILTLTANTDVGTKAIVNVNKNVLDSMSNWTFQTHPKVDKRAYEQQGLLSLKGGKDFPVNRGVGILRWSYGGDDAAPITINCWPEDEGTGSINVNVEMELTRTDLVLKDVNILLPLGTTDPPVMESIDGQYKHDARAGMLCWHFDVIDANNSAGSMEFSIAGSNTDAFFPIQVGFNSETLLCPIDVTGIVSSADGSSIPNDLTRRFSPETYQCP